MSPRDLHQDMPESAHRSVGLLAANPEDWGLWDHKATPSCSTLPLPGRACQVCSEPLLLPFSAAALCSSGNTREPVLDLSCCGSSSYRLEQHRDQT